jgi:hypothetical protein
MDSVRMAQYWIHRLAFVNTILIIWLIKLSDFLGFQSVCMIPFCIIPVCMIPFPYDTRLHDTCLYDTLLYDNPLYDTRLYDTRLPYL